MKKNNARIYDYNPSYSIYVCTPDFSTYTHLYNYEPDFVLTAALGYKAHFTQELDESLLKFILETYSVSPDADNVINDALSFFAQYKPENDIALIEDAVKDYDYPEDKDISKNANLLDTSVPLYNYRITEYESAVLAQGDTYVRPDEVFSQIEDYDRVFNDESNDLYADMYNKRCDRYISITEYSGYSSLGTYYYENGKSTEVFTLIGRMTIVNSDTGEIVGWYELPAVNTDPEKINTKNIKKINELNIVVNYPASETIIAKLYGDIDYSQIGFS